MDELYSVSAGHATPHLPEETRGGWRIYPIWGVDEQGVCMCKKGAACGDPGKHPVRAAAPRGFNSASSDPREIERMFSVAPAGSNWGLATGVGSGVAVLDVDGYDGGWASVARLEEEHGKLPPTLLHGTGSGDVHHVYGIPDHLDRLPSRTIAPGVELKADGAGVVLPPSRHALGGLYEVLIDRPSAALPEWIVEMATKPRVVEGDGEGDARPAGGRYKLPEHVLDGTRDSELFRYGSSLRARGWDHGPILEEMRRVNRERFVPPLSDKQVRTKARQAARYEKGSAGPVVTPEVLGTVAYLEEKADGRPKEGAGAHSRWAVYRALTDLAKRHGFLHVGCDVAVSVSVRNLALEAGVSKPTVLSALRALEVSRLVYRVSWGEGPRSGVLALRAPRTSPRRAQAFTTRTTPPVGVEGGEALYALRHGHDIGKPEGAVLEKVVGSGERDITRKELAGLLNKRPDDLKRPLKKLLEAGLIERPRRGTYRAAENWRRVLERERVMSGERRSQNLDRAVYERERDRFRDVLAKRKEERK